MAVQLILKNSNVEDKRPIAAQLVAGELALNYNEEGAFLSCKDSAGNIQQVGGVKIAETAPSTPAEQTLWFRSSTQVLSIYDGSSWLDVAVAPGSIVDGDVNASAAIAGTKIDPDFGTQAVTTTGEYQITGTKVLDATSLGSAVVSSSLTSVGTIGTGVWNGTALTSAYIGADAIDGTKIADDSIDSEHYVDGSIDTAHIADSQITSAKILNGTIVNADVNASAAIAGTKISPDFGSQNVITTGTAAFGTATFNLATGVELEFNSNNDRAIIDFNAPTGIGSIATQEIRGDDSGFAFSVSSGGSSNDILTLSPINNHATFSTSVSGTMRTETEVAVTSGTVVEFNNLPYWAKRISVIGYSVSFVGVNDGLCLRLKTSSGAVTTNYRSSSAAVWTPDGTNPATLPAISTTAILYGFGQTTTLRDLTHTFTSMNPSPSAGIGGGGSTVWLSSGIMGAQYNSGVAYGTVTQGGVINALGKVTGVQIFASLGSAFSQGTMTVICEG